jgi:hypothetical protein
MIKLELLEKDDIVKPSDWCRPLYLTTMLAGMSDSYSFTNQYSGKPENNVKWCKVKNILGKPWHNKTVREINKGLGKYTKYEFVRGKSPKSHQLKLTKNV